jgi:hypothetical protein
VIPSLTRAAARSSREPGLGARAVCALAADPKGEVRWTTLPQQVKQSRTMLDEMCGGLGSNEESRAREEAAWRGPALPLARSPRYESVTSNTHRLLPLSFDSLREA